MAVMGPCVSQDRMVPRPTSVGQYTQLCGNETRIKQIEEEVHRVSRRLNGKEA